MPWKGICILIPGSNTISVPGILYSLLHTLGVPGTGGCFRRVSENERVIFSSENSLQKVNSNILCADRAERLIHKFDAHGGFQV